MSIKVLCTPLVIASVVIVPVGDTSHNGLGTKIGSTTKGSHMHGEPHTWFPKGFPMAGCNQLDQSS